MYKLATWIDKTYNEISGTELFNRYFSGFSLIKMEDTYFVVNANMGIDVTFSEELIVQAVHLSRGHEENEKEFIDELPFGLAFSFNRLDVEAILGLPDISGGGFEDSLLGNISLWSKYFFETYSIHVQYSTDESYITLITIGTLNFEDDFLPE